MPKTVSIRMINHGSDDYERCKALRHKVLRVPLGLALSEKDIAGEETQWHVAAFSESGEALGTLTMKAISPTTIKMRQMAVDQATQGTGLGQRIFEFAENFAKEHGFTEIEMHARVSVLGFYEKMHYIAEGETFLESTIPHIKMRKKL